MSAVKYSVLWLGGDRDGETLGEFDNLEEAKSFAEKFRAEHEQEFDHYWGGVAVVDDMGLTVA